MITPWSTITGSEDPKALYLVYVDAEEPSFLISLGSALGGIQTNYHPGLCRISLFATPPRSTEYPEPTSAAFDQVHWEEA